MKEKIIQDYINAYNSKDVDKMTENLSDDVIFENVSNNEVTLSIRGKNAFREQAVTALYYFSTRRQAVLSFKHSGNTTEIEIDYEATAAMDFPNGIRKGDAIKLKGKSVFEFSQHEKIIKLIDIS